MITLNEFSERLLFRSKKEVTSKLYTELAAIQANLNVLKDDRPASRGQIVSLIILFDLPRDDRLELASIILGFDLPTFNDPRLSIKRAKFLIDFFGGTNGDQLKTSLGYRELNSIREEKRTIRATTPKKETKASRSRREGVQSGVSTL